jgi:hypothetical protein
MARVDGDHAKADALFARQDRIVQAWREAQRG